MKKLPQIDSFLKIKEKTHLLDILGEIEIANKYIQMSLLEVLIY